MVAGQLAGEGCLGSPLGETEIFRHSVDIDQTPFAGIIEFVLDDYVRGVS